MNDVTSYRLRQHAPKALIKRERKSSQVFRKLACDYLRCHQSNVGTSRRNLTFASSNVFAG